MAQDLIDNSAGGRGPHEEFERAAELVKQGDFEKAEPLLTKLASAEDYREEAQALLGIVLFRTGRTDQAVDCFGDLVQKRPDSESASLGLFHALWQEQRIDQAFAEMRRYRAANESMEYRRLLRDLEADGYVAPE